MQDASGAYVRGEEQAVGLLVGVAVLEGRRRWTLAIAVLMRGLSLRDRLMLLLLEQGGDLLVSNLRGSALRLSCNGLSTALLLGRVLGLLRGDLRFVLGLLFGLEREESG